MSNLGLYQWMTTMSKKVGGPLVFMALTAGVGAVCSQATNITCEKISVAREKKKIIEEAAIIHTISREGKSNEGLEFHVGDQFRVLERDGDAVLIERIGNQKNPYFVSQKFLSSISDYKIS